MARLSNIYQDENISFNYPSTWEEQDSSTRGDSCIKALGRIENNLPSTITIYAYPEENDKSTSELFNELKDSFTNQGMEIVNGELGSIDGVDSIKIVSNAKIESKTLQLHETFLFNDNLMYVFELTSFPEATSEIEDYNDVVNSLIFLQ